MRDVAANSVLAHWTRLVRQKPDAPALIEAATGLAWTRAELDAQAGAWRSALADNIAGQRVAFALPNGMRWFAVFIGLLHADAIPVPLDPSEPAASQRMLASASGASWLWIDEQLVAVTADTAALRSPDECLVKLTSGSTGRPQTLAFTHAQMLADGRQVCSSMGIASADLNFAVIPFGHSYGLGNLVLPLLVQGTPLVCASVPLPHALATDIARWQPTVFPAVPALLRALAQADLSADSLACLRTVISAGSPLPADTARAFFDKFRLCPHSFYGSSETGGITYDRTGEATLAGRSVGTPLDGVTLTPLDDGRVRVASEAVHGEGTFIPADRVSFNEHGELVLEGRAGRLVKLAGRRLDLGDLERTLRALPDVRDAFVCLHPKNPDELAAVLTTDRDAGTIRALLRREVAAWKIPRRIVVAPEFPLTARGKPDTAALQRLVSG